MANDHILLRGVGTAGEDLSAKQYFFVKRETGGILKLAGAGQHGYSLQTNPVEGEVGTIALVGIAKAIAGSAITDGEPISVNSTGKAVPATATVITSKEVTTEGTLIVGYAVGDAAEGATVSFQIASGRI